MASGEEAERELQVQQRARVAGELRLASCQAHATASASHSSMATITPALPPASQSQRPGSSSADVKARSSSSARLSVGAAAAYPVGHSQRESVEQNVDRTRRVGAGRRGSRGLGGLHQAAGDVEVGRHRGPERLEVRLAGQVGVERLETSRRAHEQPTSVAGTSLLQRDLSAQEVDTGALERVERPCLDCDEQS